MNTAIVGQIILFFITFLAFWYLFFWMYRQHTIDQFRERMFELRDTLFDDAADGLISFDHPAYTTLRRTMNGFIRFGHRISLFEIFIIMATNKPQTKSSFAVKYSDALRGLEPRVVERLNIHKERMIELVVIQSFAASPVFVLFLLSCAAPKIFWTARDKALAYLAVKLSVPIEALESTALLYGQ